MSGFGQLGSAQIGRWLFTLTCSACPEQYDVTDAAGRQVAYVKLRSGRLTVETPDAGGDLVYVNTWPDEPLLGMFPSNAERAMHLSTIATLLEDLSA